MGTFSYIVNAKQLLVKIATIGDNVVDCYRTRGEMYPGGNCINVAINARRSGAATAYVGAVGRDTAGDVIAAALSAEGVDISHLRRLDGPTAYCIIGHKDGDRVFESFDLGVSMFTPSADDLAFLKGFDAVHVGQSSGLDAHIQAIAACAQLSYDFSVRRDRPHRLAIGPHCFLASVSGGDLEDHEANAIAHELVQAGAQWVLITRGRHGAFLFNGGHCFVAKPNPVTPVDTLGAGDAFIARTLYGLIAGETPNTLLSEAATFAARTCLYFGAVGHAAPLVLPASYKDS